MNKLSMIELIKVSWVTYDSPIILILFSLGKSVFAIISMYFIYRLSVSMIIAAKASLLGESIAVSSAYGKAKSFTWRFIGFALLLGLMLVIPLLLIVFGTVVGEIYSFSFSVRIILIIIGAVPAIYLYTVFRFSLNTIVMHPEESKIFTYSKNLVKGNFFKVFIIVVIAFLASILTLAPEILYNFNQLRFYTQLIVSVLRVIPGMLFSPFIIILSLAIMNKLEESKTYEEVIR